MGGGDNRRGARVLGPVLVALIAAPTGLAVSAKPAAAAPPQIVAAEVRPEGENKVRIDVTLRHPDTGWDHYADGWSVTAPDGRDLGFRELLHPHVDEQPFTRSLGGIVLPLGVTSVVIRARCSVDGWSDDTLVLKIEP